MKSLANFADQQRASNDMPDITFRDYQIHAISSIFTKFGIEPAGPPEDQIVAACSGNGVRENGDDGRTCEVMANGASDDDLTPF